MAKSLIKITPVAFIPVNHQQQSYQASAEMRPVGYIVPRAGAYAGEQLDGGITQDKPFNLDRHKKVEIDKTIWEEIAKGCQAAEDGSRSAHGGLVEVECGIVCDGVPGFGCVQ